MEVVTANVKGGARKVTFRGRSHYVVPARLIVPGVLAGSQGPLLYTVEENRRNPDAWNGMPLVVYHPTANGKPTSARAPEILDKHGVGYAFHTKADGPLDATLYFDEEDTRRVDSRVLQALEAGRPIELSTGLYLDHEPAPAGAALNGKAYTHIARNYRPDHVAILPDQRGACSLDDGCGVLVNEGADERRSLWRRLGDMLGLTGDPASNASYFGDCPRDEHGRCKPSGQGDDTGKGDKGKDGSPHPALSVAASVLKGTAKASWLAAKVSAKVVSATAKTITSGLKVAYRRYGDRGSLLTFLVGHTIFSGASVVTGGGAALVGAAAFGLASVEARNAIAGLIGLTGGEDAADLRKMATKGLTKNADDTGLAEFIANWIKEVADAAGVPPPKVTAEKVKSIIAGLEKSGKKESKADNAHTANIREAASRIVANWFAQRGATRNAFCATGEGGGVDPGCSPGGKGAARTPRAARPPDVRVQAAADKVAAINTRLAAAKAEVKQLTADLKAAKADLAAVKAAVKSGAAKAVGARAKANAEKVESAARELKALTDDWLGKATADEARAGKTSGKFRPTAPAPGEMEAKVNEIAGKVSAHALAKALGALKKFKSSHEAMVYVRSATVGRVGSYQRANA